MAAKAFAIILLLAFVAALMWLFRQQLDPPGVRRGEYEGRIVNKHQTGAETKTGSCVTRRLVIEGKNGERFQVMPTADVYERARVGMLIRGGGAGVELSWPATRSPAPESAK